MNKLFLGLLVLFLLEKCSSTAIRGDEFREQWLKENLYNEEVERKKARPDEVKTYNLQVAILVAEKNLEGNEWNQERRRQKPSLKLYHLKGDYDQILLCEKSQTVTLHCEYPLRLQGQDMVNLRLVDRQNNYARVEYGSKYNRDAEINQITEEPLSQLDFIFEGQGKYLKNSGGATFVLTFKEIKIK